MNIARYIIAALLIVAFLGAQEYFCDWGTPFNKLANDLNAYERKLEAGVVDIQLRARVRREMVDLENCPCF